MRNPNFHFIYDLIFPSEEVIVFPADMGISGLVFKNNSFKIENNHGVVLGSKQQDPKDEAGTFTDENSEMSFVSRLKNVLNSSDSSPVGKMSSRVGRKRSKKNVYPIENSLERIMEDKDPQAENEIGNMIRKRLDTSDINNSINDSESKILEQTSKILENEMSTPLMPPQKTTFYDSPMTNKQHMSIHEENQSSKASNTKPHS